MGFAIVLILSASVPVLALSLKLAIQLLSGALIPPPSPPQIAVTFSLYLLVVLFNVVCSDSSYTAPRQVVAKKKKSQITFNFA